MPSIERTVTTSTPSERVWAFLTDFGDGGRTTVTCSAEFDPEGAAKLIEPSCRWADEDRRRRRREHDRELENVA